MIIVPLGRADAESPERPWLTLAIIALNVVMYVFFCLPVSNSERQKFLESWKATVTYLEDRPYLETPRQIAALMPEELRSRRAVESATARPWELAGEQNELLDMASQLRRQYAELPDVRMSYIPRIGSFPTVMSSMFLHAGIFHLLGNMIFLFATAPSVEERFGRALFAFLYLSGGVVATLAFAARDPRGMIPLVGASGAIAAIMGAYLVAFIGSRMKFLFVPLVFIPHWNYRFTMPALLFLPIWFIDQIGSIPAESSSGVAVSAHVAGFAYGLCFALITLAIAHAWNRTQRSHRPAPRQASRLGRMTP